MIDPRTRDLVIRRVFDPSKPGGELKPFVLPELKGQQVAKSYPASTSRRPFPPRHRPHQRVRPGR